MNAIVLTLTCRFCSQPRNPHEFVGDPVVAPCFSCAERQQKYLELLAGEPVRGCMECNTTVEELEAQSPTGDVRMKVHVKDGMYQLLCFRCSDVYERKRLDLYGRTPYGQKLLAA